MHRTPLNIAVIGSGIAGLSAAWLLSHRHRITLFEKEGRLGGHSNTVDVQTASGTIPVDTGFIVFNRRCYPNLVALFDHLNVAFQGTNMSFGVSLDDGRLEYSGSDSIAHLFAQKRNLLRPRFWRMLSDIARFYKLGAELGNSLPDTMTLGELLHRHGFTQAFRDDHLLPMGAAIWSTPTERMLDYPAKAFLRFCDNHGLLQIKDRPQWQTVVGGSREYVNAISRPLADGIRLNCGATSIERHTDHVRLRDSTGKIRRFDHVVLAGHADQSRQLLSDPSTDEERLLGAFPYEYNRAILHGDPLLMPKRRAAWSSWNYLGTRAVQPTDKVSVTYWMNKLQSLDVREPILVTLNPDRQPRPHLVHDTFDYQHPVFDSAALDAQQRLWSLQGQRRTWYCGSYFGYGFHEDALQSGLAVAEQLGGLQRPWQVDDANGRISISQEVECAA